MDETSALISGISANMHAISQHVSSCPAEQLTRSFEGKWSIAEQIVHLNKSVAPINMAMGLPKLTFYIFGKASFSRPYDEVVNNYKASLSQGAKASKAYVPDPDQELDPERLLSGFENKYNTYLGHLRNWSDKDLNTYRLPHPILGKLTMREMACFTKYHLEHHLNSMKQIGQQH